MGFLGRTKRGGKTITRGEEEGKGEKGREGTYPEITELPSSAAQIQVYFF